MTLQSETQPAAQDRQASAAQHLSDLIGFDTVSRNGNRPLIDHMAAYLEGLGARITILPDETGAKAKIYSPDDFRFEKDRPRTTRSGNILSQVNSAAVWLSPVPPPKAKTDGEEEETEEETEDEIEPLAETGPLGEKGWEYFWCIFDEEEPENTLIGLASKPVRKTKRPSRVTKNSRGRSSRITRNSRRPSRVGRANSRVKQVFFRVKDRWIVDESMELDFYVHQADSQKLVYWVKDDTQTMYTLPRVAPTQYWEQGKKGLGWELGPEKPQGEDEKSKEEEEEEEEEMDEYEDEDDDEEEGEFGGGFVGMQMTLPIR